MKKKLVSEFNEFLMKKEFPKCRKCWDKGYSYKIDNKGIGVYLCDCERAKDLQRFFTLKKDFKE